MSLVSWQTSISKHNVPLFADDEPLYVYVDKRADSSCDSHL